jgi:phosphohistidine phosphatase
LDWREKAGDVTVYLVHHGAAVDPQVEAMRPLSEDGRRDTEQLARLAADRGVRPLHVWHSGKLRAKQTAELYWRHCNALASFKAVRGLQPTDDPTLVHHLLLDAADAPLMLVGHYPHLPATLRLLTTGSLDVVGGAETAAAAFPQHGLVALEPTADPRLWRESFRLAPAEGA